MIGNMSRQGSLVPVTVVTDALRPTGGSVIAYYHDYPSYAYDRGASDRTIASIADYQRFNTIVSADECVVSKDVGFVRVRTTRRKAWNAGTNGCKTMASDVRRSQELTAGRGAKREAACRDVEPGRITLRVYDARHTTHLAHLGAPVTVMLRG